MADRKITDLTALTTPASADVLPIVDVSEAAAADKNKKITVGELFKGVPDGTAAAPAIAFESDDGNGIFLSTTDTVGIATNGSSRMTVSTTAVTSTLPVIVPDGTAAAPSVAFTGSGTDTGIYSPGVDQVAVSTGGTGRLFVDASGNVGVGVTNPEEILHVAAESENVNSRDGVILQSTSSLAADTGLPIVFSADIGSGITNYGIASIAGRKENATASNGAGYLQFATGDSGGAVSEKLRITSAGLVGIGTGSPSRALHVNAGTTDTVALFESTDAGCQINFQDSTSVASGASIGCTGDSFYIRSGLTSTRVTVDSIGNVGIGTASPGTALHLGNSSTLRINNPDGTRSLDLFNNGSNAEIKATVDPIRINAFHSSGYVRFDTNNLERARIDSSGRLLVGTATARANFFNTTATAGLQLESTDYQKASLAIVCNNTNGGEVSTLNFAKSNGSSNGSNTLVASGDNLGYVSFQGNDGSDFVEAATIKAQVDGTPGANDMPGRLVFSVTADGASSPTERMTIKSDGRCVFSSSASTTISRAAGTGPILTNSSSAIAGAGIEIATDTTATRYCQIFTIANSIVGSITTSGAATAYNTSSDYRLKENVTPVSDGITRLQQLKPARFNFIADPDTVVDGFIAHEVQTIVPEAITGEKDAVDDDGNPEYQGIDQSKLVPLLTAALQEAIGRIETLEAEVSALKGA